MIHGKDMELKDICKNSSVALKDMNLVYFLLKKNEVVYVGKTTRGLERVFSHTNSKDFDSYSVISVDLSVLDETEAYYIMKFKPKYNNDYPWYVSINTVKRRIKELHLYNNAHYKKNIMKAIKELDIPTYLLMKKGLCIEKENISEIIDYISIQRRGAR